MSIACLERPAGATLTEQHRRMLALAGKARRADRALSVYDTAIPAERLVTCEICAPEATPWTRAP